MKRIFENFLTTEFDAQNRLSKADIKADESYNFGFDVIDEIAKKTPDKTAMIWLSHEKEEKRFTFDELRKFSNMTANYFLSLGIKKGDKVLLVLRRHYQFWFSIIALHKIGAIAIPATNQLTKKDFTYRFNKASVKAAIITDRGEVANEVEKALPECPTVDTAILVNSHREGWLNFDEGIMMMSDEFDRETMSNPPMRDEHMLMFFTSGTTGYPKIVAHKHTYSLGHIVTAKYWHNTDPDGIHFTISDTGWAKAAWGKIYGQWLNETCIFVYDFDRFAPDDILPLIAKYQITTFCAPPTMYRFFIKEDLSKYDFSSLKYATTAGEALNAEVFKRFKEHTSLEIMEGFGQSETTLLIGNLVGDTTRPGSMGRPNPQYTIELLDSDDKPVQNGEVGEICISLKNGIPYGILDCYYLDEEATNKSIKNGYYHTGDTAWQDKDLYFWYEGRTDDIIKSSGYRIGPFEIESVILELPYVLECAVTSAKDTIRGNVVKATIVLTSGSEGNNHLVSEIQNYVKEHTAPYKYPRIVDFIDALPKTESGKIKRAELRA